MKQIRKLSASSATAASCAALHLAAVAEQPQQQNGDNIYEEVNDELALAGENALPNFESSSLVLLLYNAPTSNTANKLMLKIGFSTFSAKNIWYFSFDLLIFSRKLFRFNFD